MDQEFKRLLKMAGLLVENTTDAYQQGESIFTEIINKHRAKPYDKSGKLGGGFVKYEIIGDEYPYDMGIIGSYNHGSTHEDDRGSLTSVEETAEDVHIYMSEQDGQYFMKVEYEPMGEWAGSSEKINDPFNQQEVLMTADKLIKRMDECMSEYFFDELVKWHNSY